MSEKETLKRLRSIVEEKAKEMGWREDDVLGLAASTFARGNPILDAEKLQPFKNYERITGIPIEDTVHEALEEFDQACLSSRLEALAENTGSA